MKKIDNKLLIAISIFILGILFRVLVFDFESNDYLSFLKIWWNIIEIFDGVKSLSYTIGNYQPTYIFLMTMLTYITDNSFVAVKLLSCFFDVIMSIAAYFIGKNMKMKNPLILASVVFTLPGVIVNSSMISQCDAIYTAFVLLFVFFIIKDKPKIACLFYGIALSFKLQAIFVAPIFLYLLITKKVKIYDLVFCILGFFVFLSPAIIAGKTMDSFIVTYLDQIELYRVFSGSLSNFYTGIGLNYVEIPETMSTIITIIVIIGTIFIVLLKKGKKIKYSDDEFLLKCMMISVFVPFFLPQMLDRYMYMANVFVLIYFWDKPNTKSIIVSSSIAWSLCVFMANINHKGLLHWNYYNMLNNHVAAMLSFFAIYKIICYIDYTSKFTIKFKKIT